MKQRILMISLVIVGFAMIGTACIFSIKNAKSSNIVNEKLYTTDIKYVVKKNETLEQVAEKFNLFEDKLLKLNRMSKKDFKPGKELIIPNVTYCAIDKNEPIKEIAFEFNLAINTIKKANDLKDYDLSKKDYLLLPNTIVYVAKDNINLSEVASMYDVSLEKLKEYNFKKDDILKANNYVLIPKKACSKIVDGEIYTKEDEVAITALNSLAESLYYSGEYKNLSKCSQGHYLIAAQTKYVDKYIYDYLIRCPRQGVIIKFDFPETKLEKGSNKFIIKHKFQQNIDEIGKTYLETSSN